MGHQNQDRNQVLTAGERVAALSRSGAGLKRYAKLNQIFELCKKRLNPSLGGARAGAGRKAADNPRNVRVSFSFTALAADNLQRAADAAGVSRNDWMNTMLERLSETLPEH